MDIGCKSSSSIRARRWIGSLAVSGLVLLLPNSSLAHRCTGDCDGDDVVNVSELVRSVRIALAEAPLARCFQIDADRDGAASIDELLLAVSNVFTLCGHALPIPTPTEPLGGATLTP